LCPPPHCPVWFRKKPQKGVSPLLRLLASISQWLPYEASVHGKIVCKLSDTTGLLVLKGIMFSLVITKENQVACRRFGNYKNF
jgi:hypothetical protein